MEGSWGSGAEVVEGHRCLLILCMKKADVEEI